MGKGRKPLPTKLKLLRGNPGKRKLPAAGAGPKPTVPDCPSFLTPEAKAEWKAVVGELAALGILASVDAAMLAAYCQARALWAEAVAAIAKGGAVLKLKGRRQVPSPWVAIANKQLELVHRFGSEFGLSPASRTRLRIGGDRGEDPLDAFLRSG